MPSWLKHTYTYLFLKKGCPRIFLHITQRIYRIHHSMYRKYIVDDIQMHKYMIMLICKQVDYIFQRSKFQTFCAGHLALFVLMIFIVNNAFRSWNTVFIIRYSVFDIKIGIYDLCCFYVIIYTMSLKLSIRIRQLPRNAFGVDAHSRKRESKR